MKLDDIESSELRTQSHIKQQHLARQLEYSVLHRLYDSTGLGDGGFDEFNYSVPMLLIPEK